jgi:hypothetical protein
MNMQSVDLNGLMGPIKEFNEGEIQKMLKDPNIDHVDVFEGTKENLEKRQKLVGKKYKVAKRYQKAPRIK